MSTRVHPWEYDRALYKRRNEIERLFRRLKGFRRIFSRFEKLDVVFLAFLSFALIVEALRLCEHALERQLREAYRPLSSSGSEQSIPDAERQAKFRLIRPQSTQLWRQIADLK